MKKIQEIFKTIHGNIKSQKRTKGQDLPSRTLYVSKTSFQESLLMYLFRRKVSVKTVKVNQNKPIMSAS